MAVARGLCEPDIETAAPRSCDMGHDAIEDLAVLFVLVEAVVQVGAQETPALRSAASDRPLHRPLRVAVLEVGNHVANGGHTQPGHGRVLRGVYQLIEAAGLESGFGYDVD